MDYPKKEAAVIMCTRNRLECLHKSIPRILDAEDTSLFDLFIVDSSSELEVKQYLLNTWSEKATLIFENEDLSYDETNNRIMRMCMHYYSYMYLVNNDTYPRKNWLSNAISCAKRHQDIAGHIASKQITPEGIVQAAGANLDVNGCTIGLGTGKRAEEVTEEYICDYAGFGLYISEVFKDIGGLCEDYYPIYFSDPHYALDCEVRGLKVIFCPTSEIEHELHPSDRAHFAGCMGRNHNIFKQNWGKYLQERPLKGNKGIPIV